MSAQDVAHIEAQWEKLPHLPLGHVPDDLPEREPLHYRRIVAKRAILAGYEAGEPPPQLIADLLADLRHLCDGLGLDFGELDRQAFRHYATERVQEMERGRQPS
jgi:hypothetical protein